MKWQKSTPQTKIVLRKRKKLRWNPRARKCDKADHLTVRITVPRERSKALSKAANNDTSHLWQLLRRTGHWSDRNWYRSR